MATYTAWDNSALISSATKSDTTQPASEKRSIPLQPLGSPDTALPPESEKEPIHLQPLPPNTTSSDSDSNTVCPEPEWDPANFVPPPPIAVYSGHNTRSNPASSDSGNLYTKAEVDRMFQSVLRTLSRQANIVDNMRANQQPLPEFDDLPFETQCNYTTAQINDMFRRLAGRIDQLARDVDSLRQRLDDDDEESESESDARS